MIWLGLLVLAISSLCKYLLKDTTITLLVLIGGTIIFVFLFGICEGIALDIKDWWQKRKGKNY